MTYYHETNNHENCGNCAVRRTCEKATHIENYHIDSGCSDFISEEDYEAIIEETNNNLARALIEAGGEIDSLENDKRRLIYSLNETVKWLNYFLTHNRDDVYYDEAHEARWRAEYLLMDLEGTE